MAKEYRVEYRDKHGVARNGFTRCYGGVKVFRARHKGPEPIRYFYLHYELIDTGKRLALKEMPSAALMLERTSPFVKRTNRPPRQKLDRRLIRTPETDLPPLS